MNLSRLILAATTLFAVSTPLTARADVYFDCTPIEVTERSNRVDVRCEDAVPVGVDILALDWISYVTFPKTDIAQMTRFMDLASKALIEGHYFRVFVPTDPSGNLNGCLESNCRTVSTPFTLKKS
jgi:hypothetical protein